jgi:hypothetical protein
LLNWHRPPTVDLQGTHFFIVSKGTMVILRMLGFSMWITVNPITCCLLLFYCLNLFDCFCLKWVGGGVTKHETQMYWAGRLSQLVMSKVDLKWWALCEVHEKVLFLAMLISHVFMFDVLCAVFSSFHVLGPCMSLCFAMIRANPAWCLVELEPCLVACTWCFAQTGLTLHCVDFTLNACAPLPWVDFTRTGLIKPRHTQVK